MKISRIETVILTVRWRFSPVLSLRPSVLPFPMVLVTTVAMPTSALFS